MKKLLGIALVLAVMTTLCFGTVALATPSPDIEPVDVVIDWGGGTFDAGGYPVDYGAGYIGATVTGGDDAITTFSSQGNAILGQFTADYTAGSYAHCHVNTLVSRIDASVASGGFIQYQTQRTDGCPSGQVSNSFVGTGTFDSAGKVFTYGPAGTCSMGTGSVSHLNWGSIAR